MNAYYKFMTIKNGFTRTTLFIVAAMTIGVDAKRVNARINEIVSQACPTSISSGASDDIIVKDSVKVDFQSAYAVAGADELRLRDADGKRHTITFPGCYDVTVTMQVSRPLYKPYSEAYLQLGKKLPCRTFDEYTNVNTGKDLHVDIATICSNITQPYDWCPISTNEYLRSSNPEYADSSCRFCDACRNVVKGATDLKNHQNQKYVEIVNRNGDQNCNGTNPWEPYSLKMRVCTPSSKELEDNNAWRDYKQHFKYGSMVFVAHILERQEFPEGKLNDCQRLCSTLNMPELRNGHLQLVEAQTKNMCQPRDEYVGCVYTVMSFDIMGG